MPKPVPNKSGAEIAMTNLEVSALQHMRIVPCLAPKHYSQEINKFLKRGGKKNSKPHKCNILEFKSAFLGFYPLTSPIKDISLPSIHVNLWCYLQYTLQFRYKTKNWVNTSKNLS